MYLFLQQSITTGLLLLSLLLDIHKTVARTFSQLSLAKRFWPSTWTTFWQWEWCFNCTHGKIAIHLEGRQLQTSLGYL